MLIKFAERMKIELCYMKDKLEIREGVCGYWRHVEICAGLGGTCRCVRVLEVREGVFGYWRYVEICAGLGGTCRCVRVLEVRVGV